MGEISTPQAAERETGPGLWLRFGSEQGGRVTNHENVHQSLLRRTRSRHICVLEIKVLLWQYPG